MIDGFTEKKPICIIAQEAGGIPVALMEGFKHLGVKADLFIYNKQLLVGTTLINRLCHRIADPGYQKDIECLFNKAISDLKDKLRADEYSAMVIMKGQHLTQENRFFLSKLQIPLIVWTYDSLSRAMAQLDVMSIADHIYCLDGGDAREYKGRSTWLPLGYNDEYFNKSDCTKDIDVLISGSIAGYYKKRKECIEKLGKSAISKKYNCVFIGTTGFRMKDMFVKTGNINWIEKRVSPKMLGEYQSRAKICINIHQDDGIWPVNLSFFSIPGSGSCQLAERKNYLCNFMEPEIEYEEFSDYDYLKKIELLMLDEERRVRITERGYLRSKTEHTMQARAREILKKIIMLGK